ncbi:hypothetical protein [Oricola indica]
MTDLENLPGPEILADEILENLRAALASFEAVAAEVVSPPTQQS